MSIPALIGAGTLQKFPNAAVLHAFIAAAMPFWKPGSLTEEESWQVTAFILRQNGLWDARAELNASNADQVRVGANEVESTPTPAPVSSSSVQISWPVIAGGVLLLMIALAIVFISKNLHRS